MEAPAQQDRLLGPLFPLPALSSCPRSPSLGQTQARLTCKTEKEEEEQEQVHFVFTQAPHWQSQSAPSQLLHLPALLLSLILALPPLATSHQ